MNKNIPFNRIRVVFNIVFAAVLFIRQDSVVWRSLVIVFMSLLISTYTIRQLQMKSVLKNVPTEKISQWLTSLFAIMIFCYLVLFENNTFCLDSVDVFIWGLTLCVLLWLGINILKSQKFVGLCITAIWLVLFIVLHYVELNQTYLGSIAFVYYATAIISGIYLIYKGINEFPAVESTVCFALLFFAIKNVFKCLVQQEADSFLFKISQLPW